MVPGTFWRQCSGVSEQNHIYCLFRSIKHRKTMLQEMKDPLFLLPRVCSSRVVDSINTKAHLSQMSNRFCRTTASSLTQSDEHRSSEVEDSRNSTMRRSYRRSQRGYRRYFWADVRPVFVLWRMLTMVGFRLAFVQSGHWMASDQPGITIIRIV